MGPQHTSADMNDVGKTPIWETIKYSHGQCAGSRVLEELEISGSDLFAESS